MTAAPGDFDHRVAGRGEQSGALGDVTEFVAAGQRNVVQGQLLPVGELDDGAGLGRGPRAGGIRKALRVCGEEVQPGDREKAVRGGALRVVLGVPGLPLLSEGYGRDRRRNSLCGRSGRGGDGR